MRIAVFGTGGAGGYFGGRLARAGEDVTFIARGEHLRALRKQGLRVESIKGDFEIQPAQATDNPEEVGEVDVVIVGVKAWQVTEVAKALHPLVGPGSYVLPLQNGVEAASQLAAVLGTDRVLGGLAKIFSSVIERAVFVTWVGRPRWRLVSWITGRANALSDCAKLLPRR